MTDAFTALTTQALAARIADLTLRHPATRIRVGIDAAVPDDAHGLAGIVVAQLVSGGVSAHHVRTDDFLLARSIRLETGADDPDAGYWRWVDHGALRREVLDPFTKDGQFLPSLRDPERDRPTRARPVVVPERAVLVFSGSLVLRTELAEALDVRVHLLASPEAIRRRTPPEDLDRTLGAWRQYQEWDLPEQAADLVVRFDHPDRPAVQHQL